VQDARADECALQVFGDRGEGVSVSRSPIPFNSARRDKFQGSGVMTLLEEDIKILESKVYVPIAIAGSIK
jgi:hypothetical protein